MSTLTDTHQTRAQRWLRSPPRRDNMAISRRSHQSFPPHPLHHGGLPGAIVRVVQDFHSGPLLAALHVEKFPSRHDVPIMPVNVVASSNGESYLSKGILTSYLGGYRTKDWDAETQKRKTDHCRPRPLRSHCRLLGPVCAWPVSRQRGQDHLGHYDEPYRAQCGDRSSPNMEAAQAVSRILAQDRSNNVVPTRDHVSPCGPLQSFDIRNGDIFSFFCQA